MPNPFFSFKQFTIRQEEATLKVTTDACLLGAYAKASSSSDILDIGTGTGILSIMCAQRFSEARMTGIEPDPAAAEEALRNASDCPWGKRINIITGRIQDFIKTSEKKYDLILCNPPYHESQLISTDKRANLARHSLDLTFPELAFAVDKMIAAHGVFYVIVPPRQFQNMEKELAPFGLHLIDRLTIYNLPGKPVYRVIGGFSRIRGERNENTLLITNEDKNYTPDFWELLKDFYLAF
jgi:tRNA1Val (adenine37-N6)-methyltransferase